MRVHTKYHSAHRKHRELVNDAAIHGTIHDRAERGSLGWRDNPVLCNRGFAFMATDSEHREKTRWQRARLENETSATDHTTSAPGNAQARFYDGLNSDIQLIQ